MEKSIGIKIVTKNINITYIHHILDLRVVNSGAGRTIIEGANIHIFVFTDCKNNRFQKKLIKGWTIRYPGRGQKNFPCKNFSF